MTTSTSLDERSDEEKGVEKKKRSLLSRMWHPEPVPPAFAVRPDGETVEIPEQSASCVTELITIYVLLITGPQVAITDRIQLDDTDPMGRIHEAS